MKNKVLELIDKEIEEWKTRLVHYDIPYWKWASYKNFEHLKEEINKLNF